MDNKFYSKSFLPYFILLLSLLSAKLSGQAFMGTYSIGGSGSNNYSSFNTAISALNSGAVVGPVVFEVHNGTYNENVVIPLIKGVSNASSITFKSKTGNRDSVRLVANNGTTLAFNGARNIIFDGITIANTGAANVINLSFTNALGMPPTEFNTIRNCKFLLDSSGTLSGQRHFKYTVTIDKDNGFNTFENNLLIGGNYGIDLDGSSLIGPNRGNIVRNNRLLKIKDYGIRVDYQYDYIVDGNYIQMNALGNKVNQQVGIDIYFAYGLCMNNMVAGGFFNSNVAYGVYDYAGTFHHSFYNNSILMDNTSANSTAYYTGSGTAPAYFHNNILANFGGGYAIYQGRVDTYGKLFETDHNCFFTTGPKLGRWYNTDCSDLNSWKSVSGQDANSVSINPLFVSPNDLHTFNPLLNAKAKSYMEVPHDYDKQTRASAPDIGADEFTPWNFDFGLVSASLAENPKPGNSATIEVIVRNEGINSLNGKSFSLTYSLDSGKTWTDPQSFSATSLGTTMATQKVVFTKPWEPKVMDLRRVMVKFSPRESSDGLASNDTVSGVISTTVGGTMFVGNDSTATHQTIKAALNHAKLGGFYAPFTIKVLPGIYEEQVTIEQYPGHNKDNPLKIQSSTGRAQDVVVRWSPGNSPLYYVMQVNGSQYVTIEGLTIESTKKAANEVALHLTNNAQFINVRNCKLLMDSTINNSNRTLLMASGFGSFTNGSIPSAQNLVIENNTLIGGYEGIRLYGQNGDSAILIKNNLIQGFYYYGALLFYQKKNVFSNNTVAMRNTGVVSGYGIYLGYSNYDGNIIDGNLILNAPRYPIYLYYSNKAEIKNNMIPEGFIGTSVSAIYTYYSDFVEIHHNTVVLDKSGQILHLATGTDSTRISNNIFVHKAGGYCANITGQFNSVQLFDHNLMTSTGNIMNWSGYGIMANLDSVKNKTQTNLNSLSFDPPFAGIQDLHLTGPELIGKGKYTPIVNRDFDGDYRNPTGPTIGADEIPLFDLVASDMQAMGSPGNYKLKVTLANRGLNSLSNSKIKLAFSLDGINWSSPEDYTIVGLKKIGESEEFTFSNSLPPGLKGVNDICITVVPPGIPSDLNKQNDKVCKSVCLGLAGREFTVGKTGADFGSIGLAIKAIEGLLKNECGLNGNIIVNIFPDTYNEHVIVPAFNGLNGSSRVIFRSSTGNPEDVIVSSQGKSGFNNQQTIKFNQASFVRFEAISFENPTQSAGTVLTMANGSSNVELENCKLRADESSQSSDIFVVQYQNDSNMVSAVNGLLTLRTCSLTGGYTAVQSVMDVSTRIKGFTLDDCDIINPSASAVSITYGSGITLNNNRITMRSGNVFTAGLFLNQIQGGISITRNVFRNINLSGMMLEGLAGGSNGLIANNMISGEFANPDNTFGIYLSNSTGINIIHNSARLQGASFISTVVYVVNGTGHKFLNNTWEHQGNGYAFWASSTGAVAASDHNNFYSKDGFLGRYANNDAMTLDELRTVSGGKEANSINIPSQFKSADDLHTFNPGFDGKGKFDALVRLDVDGDPRDSIIPDIGADEFTLGVDGSVTKFHSPSGQIGVNTETSIVVQVNNLGNVPASNFPVSLKINGGNPIVESFTDVLNGGEGKSYAFNYKWTPTTTGSYTLCARTLISGDKKPQNDELCRTFVVGLVGVKELGRELGALRAWPNPAGKQSFISLDGQSAEGHLRIVDGMGRTVQRQWISMNAGDVLALELGDLSPGLYHLHYAGYSVTLVKE